MRKRYILAAFLMIFLIVVLGGKQMIINSVSFVSDTLAGLNPFEPEPIKLNNIFSHSFVDGTKGWENFSVIYDEKEGGLKATYITPNGTEYYAILKPFAEDDKQAQLQLNSGKNNLPSWKLDKTSYEYNMTYNTLPESIDKLGFEIETNAMIDQDPEKTKNNIIGICDFETFCIDWDFTKVDKEYNIADNTISINAKGLGSFHVDPTITFSSSDIDDMDIAPLSNDTFVVVYCDETANDASFQIWQTNGTQIKAETDMYDAFSGCDNTDSIAVSTLGTDRWVSVYTGLTSYNAWYSIYDNEGNHIANGSVKDVNALKYPVSVCSFNETAWVFLYEDSSYTDLSFKIFNNATQIVGETDIDQNVGTYVGGSVACFNSTHFAVSYTDDVDNAVYYVTYHISGNRVSNFITVDADIGASAMGNEIATLTSNLAVLDFIDTTDDDVTFAGYDIIGNNIISITDAETGTSSLYWISIARINDTAFVMSWYDTSGSDHTEMAVYDGTQEMFLTNVTLGANTYSGGAVASSELVSGIGFCNESIVFVYQYDTSTTVNWTTYNKDGTIWDGVCPEAGGDSVAPIISVLSPANDTYTTSYVDFNTSANEDLSWCGAEINLTANKTLTSINTTAYNGTFSLPNGLHSVRFFCNDTAGNMGNTTLLYFTVNKDLTTATLSVISPSNSTYNSSTINYTVNADEEVSFCSFSLDDAANQSMTKQNTTAYNNSFHSTADGYHKLIFYCNDTSNNTGSSSALYFTKDTVKPIITILLPLNDTYSTSSINFNISANEVLSWCNASINSTVFNYTMSNINDTAWNLTKEMPNGLHDVKFWCNDSAGNMANTTVRYFTVYIDTQIPNYTDNSTSGTLAGTLVSHNLYWHDETNLDGYTFYFSNCTSTTTSSNGTTTIADGKDSSPWYPNLRTLCRDVAGNLHAAFENITHETYWKSTDNGDTWTLKNTWMGTINPSLDCDGNNVVYGFRNQIWLSQDNGESWSNISHGFGDGGFYNIVMIRGSNIYNFHYMNFTKSTNLGSDWSSQQVIDGSYNAMTVVGDGGSDDKIYLVSKSDSSVVWFQASLDSGATFESNMSIFDGSAGINHNDVIGYGNNVYVAIDDLYGMIRFINSTDNGANWDINRTVYNGTDGKDVSIAIGENERPWIFWWEGTGIDESHVSKFNGEGWDNETLTPNSKMPNAKMLYDGRIEWMEFNDTSPYTVYYKYYDTSGGSTPTYVADDFVSFTDADVNDAWSNVSKTINTTVGCTIRWYVTANDTSGNSNTSEVFSYVTTSNITDTCTYVSGDWEVDCSDDCVIDDAVDLDYNNLFIYGSGSFTANQDILNIDEIRKDDNCYFYILNGVDVG